MRTFQLSVPFLTFSVVHLQRSLGRTRPRLPACKGIRQSCDTYVVMRQVTYESGLHLTIPSSGNNWVTFSPCPLPEVKLNYKETTISTINGTPVTLTHPPPIYRLSTHTHSSSHKFSPLLAIATANSLPRNPPPTIRMEPTLLASWSRVR